LEHARDDEARAAGADGADLAAALVASLRLHCQLDGGICAPLISDRSALEERVARLLQPLTPPNDSTPTTLQLAVLLTLALMAAIALGALYGERLLVGPLLAVI
jgi:hypothetical protein